MTFSKHIKNEEKKTFLILFLRKLGKKSTHDDDHDHDAVLCF